MSGLNSTLFPLPDNHDRIIAEFPNGHELPLCYAKHFRSWDLRFALILPYILRILSFEINAGFMSFRQAIQCTMLKLLSNME